MTLAEQERGRGQAFRIGLAQAERRSIWFAERLVRHGDPAALPLLLSRGVIIRIRQREGEDDDATLKPVAQKAASTPTSGVDGPSRLASAPSSRATGWASVICCRRRWTARSRAVGSRRPSPSNPSRSSGCCPRSSRALAEEWLLPLDEVQPWSGEPRNGGRAQGSWATSPPSCGRLATGCASSSCRCWPRTTRSVTSSAWTRWSGATPSRSTQRRKPRPAPCLSTSRRQPGRDRPERADPTRHGEAHERRTPAPS